MTPDQAPIVCPFCGAGAFLNAGKPIRSDDGKRVLYACGMCVDVEMADNRVSQTKTCLNAERSRLTRERDEAMERLTAAIADRNSARAQAEQVWKLREEFVALLGTDDIKKGVDAVKSLQSRVRQLESEWSGWPALQREWFGDKYASMQPWDAVRARIEDGEARVKRLEEAGDAMAAAWDKEWLTDADIEAIIDDWNKAKEAKP